MDGRVLNSPSAAALRENRELAHLTAGVGISPRHAMSQKIIGMTQMRGGGGGGGRRV